MKRCESCGQFMSRKVRLCPGCGNHLMERMEYIDDYRIQAIIHEGRSSIVCKAKRQGDRKSVSIRLFTKDSGVDEEIAARLKKELGELKKLPEKHFVQHFAIRRTKDGHWYRISEWVNAMDWGRIFMSGLLKDQRQVVKLFSNIASVLDLLNKRDHFMPYLLLDDILIPKKNAKNLQVKINYKLSRFLNARATHHGPMLQKLLEYHPDILNDRPIDFRSGIWSLGKIFVEILSADHNLKNFSDKVDTIEGLHPELRILIKIMLADDPDMRPKSMTDVAEALSDILDKIPYSDTRAPIQTQKEKIADEVSRLKKMVAVMVLITLTSLVAGIVSWLYMGTGKIRQSDALSGFVETYAGSVGFLLVEYHLFDGSQMVYTNKVEGTAFLADRDGYLLTNRHVACPWLEDTALFQVYHQHNLLKKTVHFQHRLFLWFEGSKAFNRLPALKESKEISDAYYLPSAFQSGGRGNLRILGAPRPFPNTGEIIKSPFKNDFAVLKIDEVPEHLKPLPLETNIHPEKIRRLSPVVILGFPLGNRTQTEYISASITRGHVRRTTPAIIQVDSSIYKGNSGGPAINARGKVIGIASGVITDELSEYFKVVAPLSDFGLILPIHRPAGFMADLKNGHPRWNGILDFALESKLAQIHDLAMENKFEPAAELAEKMMETSSATALLYAAGVMHFCSGNLTQSRHFLEKMARMNEQNATARLMLYIIDWISGIEKDPNTIPTDDKSWEMPWYEQDKFLGYLTQVLKTRKKMDPGFIDYENQGEKSWRQFIEGLILEKNRQFSKAAEMYQASVLNSAAEDWIYYLAFSRLNHTREKLPAYQKDPEKTTKEAAEFHEKAKKHRKTAEAFRETLGALISAVDSTELTKEQKDETYIKLMELAPENRNITGQAAFFHARNGDWVQALDLINAYFKNPARETGLSLSLAILKAEILNILEMPQASKEYLKARLGKTQDAWYKILIKELIRGPNGKKLLKLAGKKPEKLITIYTALGLAEEARKNYPAATQYYREALGTYLDDWNEYSLALGRIMQIREENPP